MNVRNALLEEHSKAQAKMIADWIDNHDDRISALVHLFMNDEYRVVQRAAWVVSEVAKKHPESFNRHLPKLVEKLEDASAHNAVKRNIFRIFEAVPIPVSLHGPLMHHCFEALENPNETLASRAFAIGILSKLMKTYPEIINEFRMLLEDYLQHESAPSFKSRANKALKEMNRINAPFKN